MSFDPEEGPDPRDGASTKIEQGTGLRTSTETRPPYTPYMPLFTRAFGLRIALWYSTLFILGAIAIVVLTYVLTATSLAQRDRQLINQKLGDYAAAYRRGGLSQLADTVSAEQRTAPA